MTYKSHIVSWKMAFNSLKQLEKTAIIFNQWHRDFVHTNKTIELLIQNLPGLGFRARQYIHNNCISLLGKQSQSFFIAKSISNNDDAKALSYAGLEQILERSVQCGNKRHSKDIYLHNTHTSGSSSSRTFSNCFNSSSDNLFRISSSFIFLYLSKSFLNGRDMTDDLE